MFVSGIQEQEAAMLAKLKANPETSFVLFPSQDSISVKQFLSRFSKDNGSPSDSNGKGKEKGKDLAESLESLKVTDYPPLNIVIIDGTWNQAKHLIYNIPPEVPRVHVDPTSPSLFLLRKVKDLSGFLLGNHLARFLGNLYG